MSVGIGDGGTGKWRTSCLLVCGDISISCHHIQLPVVMVCLLVLGMVVQVSGEPVAYWCVVIFESAVTISSYR